MKISRALIARTITLLIAAPVIWACTYFGGMPFLLLVLGLALVSVNEFYAMMLKKGIFPAYWVAISLPSFLSASRPIP